MITITRRSILCGALSGSAIGVALPLLRRHEEHGIASPNKRGNHVLVSDFGADPTGENDAAPAISAAILFASRHDKKCILPAGRYLCKTGISPVLHGSVEIEFESGAKLIAAQGMCKPVLFPRASSRDQATWEGIDLRVINPNIDCSSG